MRIPVLNPCKTLFCPTDPKYEESIRQYQGCPTIAVTRGGRLFVGWYSGGTTEPHMDNYNLLVMSDDRGLTWSKPVLVIPSDKSRLVHSLDIQLWTDPLGRLWVFWVQERTRRASENEAGFVVDGFSFGLDRVHGCWAMVCDDPDADSPVFGKPRRIDDGFLRCKPLVLQNGRWLAFNYDQAHDRYGYSISEDQGKTWHRHYGAEKINTPFDEAMAVELPNGDVHMMARTAKSFGALAETVSHDGGLTWEKARLSRYRDPSSRFFYARTPSGRLMLVKNDDADIRRSMTVFLSGDEGKTWPYSQVIDPRRNTSYPDADFFGGKVYLVHDCGRTAEKEILLTVFTEEDIIAGRTVLPRIISKP